MNYKDQIVNVAQMNNGYVTNSMVRKQGIPTVYLTELSRSKKIERVARGIYLLNGYIEDKFYSLYLQYSKLAYTRRTSLYLNGMSNRGIDYLEANFPRGYKTSNITDIKCYSPSEKKYELGKCQINTPFGNKVTGYDHERCICDLFLYDSFDIEEIQYAIHYYKDKGVSYDKLYSYAEKLNVLREVKAIFEII